MSQTNHQKFIACLQSTGRVGKSIFAETLIHWLNFAGVPFAGIDSDAEHRTLSSRHKEISFFNAVESPDNFVKLIGGIPPTPVVIGDFPAQATGFLLENWNIYNVSEVLAAKGTRLVNIIFAADDQTAQISAARILAQFGDSSDYLIVRNPARARSDEFNKLGLYKALQKAGAREITLPTILAATLAQVQEVAKARQAYVTLDEAAKDPSFPMINRFDIEAFQNKVMAQLEDTADILLPDIGLIKSRIVRKGKVDQGQIDPFNL
ncbi:MAG: hypothetical protein A3F67_03535 [Verrucomicrobia bacterium RIFCSPHIGHO2_12_FULL_41_10]|nr:MAG: hypothetical protein A3F67_03535 [Verrucomicrobia bacterium RIFCSPHIGHO2_12_FULL_41_10]